MASSADPEARKQVHALASRAPSSAGRIVFRTREDLPATIAAWDALTDQASEPNPFFESWYLLPGLHAFPDASAEILCFEEGGVLRGLMPIVRRKDYYGWPLPNLSNWLHPNCFLGVPLVAAGSEVPFWQALLGWADSNAGLALFLHLQLQTIGGPMHAALEGVLAAQDRRAEIVLSEERAMLESGLSAQAYWEASLSGKKRKELRRQASRLAELGDLQFERHQNADDLEPWTDRFLALEAAGWKGKAGSALASSPETERLFRQSLAGAARRGRLERLSLSLDGVPIAMLASFMTPPGAFSFKTAFDEDYARFSPGVLLQQRNLAVLDRDDITWSDSCASADHPMIDHIWRERRRVGHLSIAIGGALRRAAFGRIVNFELARKQREAQG